jgi:hypothetical protein
MTVLDAIYGVSEAWSPVDLITLVWLWRKLLPDLRGDDLQGFPNKEIRKSEILDMVCVCYEKFDNVNKDDHEEWLQSNAGELGFQHDRHEHC